MVQMLKRSMATLPSRRGPTATTTSSRTRGSAWQEIRRQVIERDQGLCQACARFGHVTLAREVDHARPLWAGGSDQLRNLQALCLAHHRAKTSDEEAIRAAGAVWSEWQPGPIEGRG